MELILFLLLLLLKLIIHMLLLMNLATSPCDLDHSCQPVPRQMLLTLRPTPCKQNSQQLQAVVMQQVTMQVIHCEMYQDCMHNHLAVWSIVLDAHASNRISCKEHWALARQTSCLLTLRSGQQQQQYYHAADCTAAPDVVAQSLSSTCKSLHATRL